MSDAAHDSARQENEIDRLREHEYDGIQEFDNRLPNWWLFTLYASIIFALGYWLVFHTLKVAKLPVARYEAEMVAATEAQLARVSAGGLNNESLLLMSTLPPRLEEGRQIWTQYCVVCHKENGEGLVGPNLTDDYWIHGAEPMDIHTVITKGVTAKGMAAWGNQLGPRRVESVVAYVLTLKGKHLPGKAPEGELVTEASSAGEDGTSSTPSSSTTGEGSGEGGTEPATGETDPAAVDQG